MLLPVHMSEIDSAARQGTLWGGFVGDAHAMPGHWYYDRKALHRDYGLIVEYQAPRNPHPDSILWRSSYVAENERGQILHEQARFWGQRGVHYHQNLTAGENTLNLQLARLLIDSLRDNAAYDPDDYAKRYIEFMLTPGSHRDTYVEEYHRNFFTNYARGKKPRKCGQSDIHIGGLSHVGVLSAYFRNDLSQARAAVREHVELTHPNAELLHAADTLTKILIAVMDSTPLREAIREYGNDYFSEKRTAELHGRPDSVVIGSVFSPACYIQDAFPATLYLAWKYAESFAGGIIANTNVGGDNSHRGAVLGSLLGAAVGVDGIPPNFITGLQLHAALRSAMATEPSAVLT